MQKGQKCPQNIVQIAFSWVGEGCFLKIALTTPFYYILSLVFRLIAIAFCNVLQTRISNPVRIPQRSTRFVETMSASKAKLLCNFGGEFTRQLGNLSYMGGKTRLVLVDRSVSFDELRSKLSQLTGASPFSIEIKYQLPDESLESRLVSVECEDDVVAMMSEFEASQRIQVYIFASDHRSY